MDIARYLDRIGAEHPAELTPQSLAQLTRAHLEHVPFEVLELTEAQTEPSLEAEDLFRKIVVQKRGGYCFELNKLYYLLLKELGFSCYPVGVRVLMGRPEPRPLSHRATIVQFGGEKWYCDVGFGGNGPKGIVKLDGQPLQTLVYEHFRVFQENGQYVISYLEGDKETRMLMFRDEPALDVDFNVLNGYYSAYSRSPFRQKRILYLCKPDGWISFVGNVFTTYSRGETTSREITGEDRIRQLITHEFGIHIPQWD